MTGIIRIGVTERVRSFKKYSEAVDIPLFKGCAKHETAVNILRIYRSYAESTKSRLVCRNKGWVIARLAIFLLCPCYEMNGFEMTLLAYERIRRDFYHI